MHLEAARQRVRKLQAVGNPYLQQLVEALADLNKPPASEHSPPAHFRGLLLFRRLSNQEQAFATFRARELVVDHCRNYQETGSLHDPHIIVGRGSPGLTSCEGVLTRRVPSQISKLVNLLKTRESATTLRCRRSCIEALAQVVKLYSQHAASSTDPNDPVVHLKKLLAFLEPFESAHFFNALPEDRLKSCAMRCFSIDSQVQKEWGHNGRVITASETVRLVSLSSTYPTSGPRTALTHHRVISTLPSRACFQNTTSASRRGARTRSAESPLCLFRLELPEIDSFVTHSLCPSLTWVSTSRLHSGCPATVTWRASTRRTPSSRGRGAVGGRAGGCCA